MFRQNHSSVSAIIQLCCKENDHWVSPARAPFGGIQCDKLCTLKDITFLLQCVEKFIAKKRGEKITIQTAPSCYHANSLLSECYLSSDLQIAEKYSSHSISITSNAFADSIHLSEKRRLRKCRKAGFSCQIMTHPTGSDIYDFLELCRLEKGYKISMSKSRLTELLIQFPTDIIVFTIKDQGLLIALAVTVK